MITRGEMATVLDRLLQLQTKAENSFADLGESWYTDAVLRCVAAGILQGDGVNVRPNAPITRQEAMVMLGRALAITEQAESSLDFADQSEVADWAQGYVNALTERQIVQGVGNGRLAPNDPIDRASVVTILDNAIFAYVYEADQTVTVPDDCGQPNGIVLIAAPNATLTGCFSNEILVAQGASNGMLTFRDAENSGVATVLGSHVSIVITGTSKVSQLQLTSDGGDTSVTVHAGAVLEEVRTAAANTTISGTGNIKNVIAVSGAANTTVSTYNTYVTAQKGSTNTVACGDTVLEGETILTQKPSTGVPGGGSNPKLILVLFNSNGGSAISSKAVTRGTAVACPEPPVRAGYTFRGWYLDGSAYDFTTPVVKSITLEAKWILGSTITFETNGGSAVPAMTRVAGTSISAPSAPTKTGAIFAGWYIDSALETPYTFTVMPDSNLTLYAKWTPGTGMIQYSDGMSNRQLRGPVGEPVEAPADPVKAGYVFGGWFSDQACTIPYTFTVYPETVEYVYSKWTPEIHTITFETNGAGTIDPITQETGTKLEEILALPTKEGASFAGWYSNEELTAPFAFYTMPTKDITLYAKWDDTNTTATLVFDCGGLNGLPSVTGTPGQEVSLRNPSRSGYTMVGWCTDKELTNMLPESSASTSSLYKKYIMPETSMILYPKWEANTITVTFNLNGGTANPAIEPVKIQVGDTLYAPETIPTRENATFAFWGTGMYATSSALPSSTITSNTTLYAIWNFDPYDVVYETNGGSAIDSVSVPNGSAIPKPADPVREGYCFVGWYTDPDCTEPVDFGTALMPVGGITLYAKWQSSLAQFAGNTTVNQWQVNEDGISMTIVLDEGYTFDADYVNAHKDEIIDGIDFYGQLFNKTTDEYLVVPMSTFIQSGLDKYGVNGYFPYLDVSNSVTVYDRFVGLEPAGTKSTATVTEETKAAWPGVQKGIRDALKAGGVFELNASKTELTISCTPEAADGYFASFDNSVPVCNGGVQICNCDVLMNMTLPAGIISGVSSPVQMKSGSYFSIQEMKMHTEIWEYVSAAEALDENGDVKDGYFMISCNIQGNDNNASSNTYADGPYYVKQSANNSLTEEDIRVGGTDGPNGTGYKLIKVCIDARVGPAQWASTKNMSTFFSNLFRTSKDAYGYSGNSSDTYLPKDDAEWLKVEDQLVNGGTNESAPYNVSTNKYVINYSGDSRNDTMAPAPMWMFYEIPKTETFNIRDDMVIYCNMIAGFYGGSGQSTSVNGKPILGMDGRFHFTIAATDDGDLNP